VQAARCSLLIDIEHEPDVPHGWNLSRFLTVLGQEPFRAELVSLFDVRVRHPGVGARRFHAHVGAVLDVHLAFATPLAGQQHNEGSLGKRKL
jgi:hypothetical protein